MPKLGSKKSRGGCTNCKRRRVKCDEIKPTCSNCAKYKMGCVYVRSSGSGYEGEGAARSRKSSFAHDHHRGHNRSSNSLNVLADAVSSVEASRHPAAQQPQLNGYQPPSEAPTPSPFTFTLLDLELLHHFTTQTYSTISRHNTLEVWRLHVPQLAYTREWLMRGLIAISAMHVATEPSCPPHKLPELIPLALTSMNAGLPFLNHLVSTIAVDDVESCSAIAAHTAMIAIYTLAIPSVQYFTSVRMGQQDPAEPLEDPLGNIYHTFELMQGTAEIYKKVWSSLQQGPMAPMTQVNLFGDSVVLPPDFKELIDKNGGSVSAEGTSAEHQDAREKLMERTRLLGRAVDDDLTGKERTACELAYQHLFFIVRKMIEPDEAVNRGIILAWPATHLPEFMSMLRENSPPALALLVVWALVLRHNSWLTRGWKEWIINALDKQREAVQRKGGDVGGVWWETVAWGMSMLREYPTFLEFELGDEGLA